MCMRKIKINLIINQIQKLKDSGANIILTSGGVSAGKADFIPAALTEMEQKYFS